MHLILIIAEGVERMIQVKAPRTPDSRHTGKECMINQQISFLRTLRARIRALTVTWDQSSHKTSCFSSDTVQQQENNTVLSPVQNLGQDFGRKT